MELGKRLKQARLEAGLSQRQLCGDVITRNMLSQIENGSARPSMDTLGYLAGKLGRSVSWFLEEDTVTSPNQQVISRARAAWEQGDPSRVRELLTEYQGPDPMFDWEQALLRGLAALAMARQALEEERYPYAVSLLEEAAQAGEKTPYYTPAMEGERQLLLARAKPENARLPAVDSVLILKAETALRHSDPRRAGEYLDACEKQDSFWHLLRGEVHLRLENYRQAAFHLHKAEETYPEKTAPALEQCYSALEDYKMAYFYACKQRKP